MSSERADDPYEPYEGEWVDCWKCFGEGGWAYCMEDCCPNVGGEENCMLAECWNPCDVCKGEGGWNHAYPVRTHGT